MNNMQTYEVTLKPYSTYFFGGEKNFVNGNEDYLAISNIFPQQTTLLGLIRHQLLIQNGLLKDNKITDENMAQQLIGAGSYQLNTKWEGCGVIESLSPVFLKNNLNWIRKSELTKGFKFTKIKGESTYSSGNIKNFIPLLEGYTAKDAKPNQYLNLNSPINEDEIFSFVPRIGIQKKPSNLNREKAFYKQHHCTLKEAYSFVFYVTLRDTTNFSVNPDLTAKTLVQFSSTTATMGAERSIFQLTINKENNPDYLRYFNKPESSTPMTILLSDTLVNTPDLEMVEFIVSETQDFRQFVTKTQKNHQFNNFNKNGGNPNSPVKSKLQKLLKRGGVFFFETQEIRQQFTNKLINDPNYKIGMNHFLNSQ